MSAPDIERLSHLTSQLAENLMTAAICVDEIRLTIQDMMSHCSSEQIPPTSNGRQKRYERPLLDESTFSVRWQGKSLHLGHTRLYDFLKCLARHPNQYVPHLELIQEVWDEEDIATATIRSVVRHLRNRLRTSGMAELAAAIRGHNRHYILAFGSK